MDDTLREIKAAIMDARWITRDWSEDEYDPEKHSIPTGIDCKSQRCKICNHIPSELYFWFNANVVFKDGVFSLAFLRTDEEYISFTREELVDMDAILPYGAIDIRTKKQKEEIIQLIESLIRL